MRLAPGRAPVALLAAGILLAAMLAGCAGPSGRTGSSRPPLAPVPCALDGGQQRRAGGSPVMVSAAETSSSASWENIAQSGGCSTGRPPALTPPRSAP